MGPELSMEAPNQARAQAAGAPTKKAGSRWAGGARLLTGDKGLTGSRAARLEPGTLPDYGGSVPEPGKRVTVTMRGTWIRHG